MEDVTPAGNYAPIQPKKSRRPKIKLTRPVITKIVIGLIIVAVLGGIYMLGVKHGEGKKTNSAADRLSSAASSASKRWSQIGNITEVSDKNIKIKDAKGEEEATINDKTVITGADGKKTDVKALKKDQRVIATGTKDDKGKQTATRIRIQK